MEPEDSGERQGRSWRITKGLWWTEVRRWWTEVRLSAGRAIEPKLVRGLGRRWTPERPWNPKVPVNVEDVRERPRTLGLSTGKCSGGGIQRDEGSKPFAHSEQSVKPRKARAAMLRCR